MKNLFIIFCLTSLLFIQSPVLAAIKIPANTTIPISVVQKQTGKTVVSGGIIEAKIIEDVSVENNVVFKKGDRALLNVLSAKKAGFIGIPGEMFISGGKVFDINGKEHRVDFNLQINGEEKTWPKVCVGCGIFIILAPLVLFGFVKGGQAEILPISIIETRLINEFEI